LAEILRIDIASAPAYRASTLNFIKLFTNFFVFISSYPEVSCDLVRQ
jgi:hypothetical protein